MASPFNSHSKAITRLLWWWWTNAWPPLLGLPPNSSSCNDLISLCTPYHPLAMTALHSVTTRRWWTKTNDLRVWLVTGVVQWWDNYFKWLLHFPTMHLKWMRGPDSRTSAEEERNDQSVFAYLSSLTKWSTFRHNKCHLTISRVESSNHLISSTEQQGMPAHHHVRRTSQRYQSLSLAGRRIPDHHRISIFFEVLQALLMLTYPSSSLLWFINRSPGGGCSHTRRGLDVSFGFPASCWFY